MMMNEFQTFIYQDKKFDSLDISRLMVVVIDKFKVGIQDFWKMPLNFVFESLGPPPAQQKISRLRLVRQEQMMNAEFGR